MLKARLSRRAGVVRMAAVASPVSATFRRMAAPKQAQPSEHPDHGRGAGLAYQSSLRSPVMKAWPAGVPTPVMLS